MSQFSSAPLSKGVLSSAAQAGPQVGRETNDCPRGLRAYSASLHLMKAWWWTIMLDWYIFYAAGLLLCYGSCTIKLWLHTMFTCSTHHTSYQDYLHFYHSLFRSPFFLRRFQ